MRGAAWLAMRNGEANETFTNNYVIDKAHAIAQTFRVCLPGSPILRWMTGCSGNGITGKKGRLTARLGYH